MSSRWSCAKEKSPGFRGRGLAYTGRPRPKGVPFSGFRCIKGVGISQVEVHKRVGKSVIQLKGPLVIIFK